MRTHRRSCYAAALLSCFFTGCTIEAPTFVGFEDGGAADADPGAVDADPNAPDGGTPTFTRIVHTAANRVYAADVDNGAVAIPALLSGAFTNPTATVAEFQASSDGNVITYLADATTEGDWQVYVVRHTADGFSDPLLISADHGSDRILNHVLKPNGTGVVYTYGTAPGGTPFADQRYYVDLSGPVPGTPIPLGTESSLFVGQFSADSSKYVFEEGASAFLVDVSGAVPSTAIRISGAPVSTRGVVGRVAVSPNGTKVAFIGQHVTADKHELYVVDVGGATPGTPTKVSGTFQAQGDVARCAFSPDSSRIAFTADATVDETYELFVVDLSGASPGPATVVNGTLVSGGSVSPGSGILGVFGPGAFAFARGGDEVAYIADERIDGTFELFIVDATGSSPGASQRLNSGLVSGGNVGELQATSDGEGLAYTADQRVDQQIELFYVDLSGAVPSASQLVNGDLSPDLDVASLVTRSFSFSADGTMLLFIVADGNFQQQQLHRSAIAAGVPGSSQPLQDVTNFSSSIAAWELSGDGGLVVFRGNPVSSAYDIWAVDVSGPTSPEPERVNIADPAGNFQLRP